MHLDEMLASKDTANGIKGYCDHSKEIFLHLAHVKPVYVYDGVVMGGGFEWSLFADFRFCSDDTTVKLPELSIGILQAVVVHKCYLV